MAQKFDFQKGDYEPYDLPEGASMFEDDMAKEIACAECATKVKFGDTYTSRRIHTTHGFGYMVCESCYEKEVAAEKKGRSDRHGRK